MLKHKQRWLLLLILCLVGMIGWQLRPRSFADTFSKIEETNQLILALMEIEDDPEKGITLYQTDIIENQAAYDKLTALLEQSTYRPSFLNLLPIERTSIESKDNKKTVSLYFYQTAEQNPECQITFLSDGQVHTSFAGQSGFKVYFLSDLTLVDTLAAYVKTEGTVIE